MWCRCHRAGWLAFATGLVLSGCPQPSSTVPYPTAEPCVNEGEVFKTVACGDDQYAVESCVDGKRSVSPCGQEVGCRESGEVGTAACGFNGRGQTTRSCIVAKRVGERLVLCRTADEAGCALRWSSFSPCAGDDVCRDGVTQRVVCEDWVTTRERECNVRVATEGGVWNTEPCEASPDAVCQHGRTEVTPCGDGQDGGFFSIGLYAACFHGRQAKPTLCRACDPGTSTSTKCGLNGNIDLMLSCTPEGVWDMRCVDPDQCVTGATRHTGCGVNGRGIHHQTCSLSAAMGDPVMDFVDDGQCVDPDECTDGERQVIEGECATGRIFQRCVNGQWMGKMCLPECDDARPCLFGSCHFREGETRGVCLQPSCDDGIWNGTETSTDAGGQQCPATITETLCDGRDGNTGEASAPIRECGVGECKIAFVPEAPDAPCGPSRCIPRPPSIELPANDKDDDCDGAMDELAIEE